MLTTYLRLSAMGRSARYSHIVADRVNPFRIEVTIQVDADVAVSPPAVYGRTAHGFESSPAVYGCSAIDFMAWEPKQVVYLCGRLVYLSEIDGIVPGDGHEEDLACMINAIWDWSVRALRFIDSGPNDRLLVIDRLAVPPEFQGQRVGQRAVSALLRQFPNTLVTTIPAADERTKTAQERICTYWSKLGFTPTPSDPPGVLAVGLNSAPTDHQC